LFSRLYLFRINMEELALTITQGAIKSEGESLCDCLLAVATEKQNGAVNC